MEQTINILTERERQLDDINQAIRETQYPPLNGGPTIQDLAGLLKGAAATIEELGDQVDEMEESADRCDELQDTVDEAANELEDVILDLSELSEGLKKTAEEPQERMICKALEEIEGKIRAIYSDLRRA
jgi:DNA repair exonuclease SbcCD ATPase subunit